MCTNTALVNSLESYMDDLVDCFEDFVRKSLLLISVALGTIILMVMYVLKVLAERATVPRSTNEVPALLRQDFQYREESTPPSKEVSTPPSKEVSTPPSKEVTTQDSMLSKCHTTLECHESTTDPNQINAETDNSVNDDGTSTTTNLPCNTSYDETVLREIGLSTCSKPCNTSKTNLTNSGSRIAVPSLPTCMAKHHLSSSRPCKRYIAIRSSCCSMCCVDDDRR